MFYLHQNWNVVTLCDYFALLFCTKKAHFCKGKDDILSKRASGLLFPKVSWILAFTFVLPIIAMISLDD